LNVDHDVVVPLSDVLSDSVHVTGNVKLVSIVTLEDGFVTDVRLHGGVSLDGVGTLVEAYNGFGAHNWSFAPGGPPILPSELGGALSTAQLDTVIGKLVPTGPPNSPVFQPGSPPIMPLFVSLSLDFDDGGQLLDSSLVGQITVLPGLGD
jgi:hypothetical protein